MGCPWLSRQDGAVLMLCGFATWALWPVMGQLALLFPVVVGHFFLFCNIFRVRRTLEIAWSVIFIINASLWLVLGPFTWWGLLAVQTPATAGIILYDRFPCAM